MNIIAENADAINLDYHLRLYHEINNLKKMKADHELHDHRILLFENILHEETQKGNFEVVRQYEFLIQKNRIAQQVNYNEYMTKELYIQQLKDENEIINLNCQMNQIHIQNNQLVL
jgi:hypothetical protein